MPHTFTPPDYEFAAASGSNVNFTDSYSYFDHPPNSTSGLTITTNSDDPDPFTFNTGEMYDISWSGHGGGMMEDAVVIRSDYLSPGEGAIVFEGINTNTGELYQIVWSPGFDLEQWYFDAGGPSNPPRFWTSDQDAQSYQFVCFVRGTLIDTPRGQVRVEDLQPGHRVSTFDDGGADILWIGNRHVAAQGSNAPVRVEAGAIGNETPLYLSQQHRVLLERDGQEILAPAKSLIASGLARTETRQDVEYFHLLMPKHMVIRANGAGCESLYLGEIAMRNLCAAARKEIASFFPGISGYAVHPKSAMQQARPFLGRKAAERMLAAKALPQAANV